MHVLNEKVISLILGSPGSGKSTMAAKIVYMANKAGIPAYCNYPVLGARVVDLQTMVDYNLGKAVLIIDEAGLAYNSRSSTQKGSKSFTSDIYHWYATTRHRETQVFVIVQSWKRIDTILRELATEVILCRKWFFGFTRWIQYQSETTLIEDKDGNAIEFNELFSRISGHFFWRPKYYHMFDSFHLDKEYLPAPQEVYDPSRFPERLPLWRRILGTLVPLRSRARSAAKPPTRGSGESPLLDNSHRLQSPKNYHLEQWSDYYWLMMGYLETTRM